MALPFYLAMTASEIENAPAVPPEVAWMACHFSPCGTGLSNFPQYLPENALLIVNDSTPFEGHDPQQIARELQDAQENWNLSGIVLDFQRSPDPRTLALTESILQTLTCPVLVSDGYAKPYCCPVFLSAPPLYVPLTKYLAPWCGREIWLEAALDMQELTLTKDGCKIDSLPFGETLRFPWEEPTLHCTYKISTSRQQAKFTLQRDKHQLALLLEEAKALGIHGVIGLYQQLGSFQTKTVSD